MNEIVITSDGIQKEMKMLGFTSKRHEHKLLIINYISSNYHVTHKELSSQLSIRPNSIGKYIDELVKSGLVLKKSNLNSGGKGRPVSYLSINLARLVALTVTVHSRMLTFRLIDCACNILSESRVPVERDVVNEEMHYILDSHISSLLANQTLDYTLSGIIFLLPGWVDQKSKKWSKTARFRNICELSFDHYSLKYVTDIIVKPLDHTALSYHIRNDERFTKGNVVMLSWGWSIVCDLGIDGSIFRNSERQFGHIGHTTVNTSASAKLCDCGSLGCLETEASQWALLDELRIHLGSVPTDEVAFADFLNTTDVSHLECINNAINYIIIALNNLSRMFYPDHIIVTGAFVHNPWIVKEIENRWCNFVEKVDSPWPSITLSVCEDFESEIGAIYPIFEWVVAKLIDER